MLYIYNRYFSRSRPTSGSSGAPTRYHSILSESTLPSPPPLALSQKFPFPARASAYTGAALTNHGRQLPRFSDTLYKCLLITINFSPPPVTPLRPRFFFQLHPSPDFFPALHLEDQYEILALKEGHCDVSAKPQVPLLQKSVNSAHRFFLFCLPWETSFSPLSPESSKKCKGVSD